MSSNLSLIMDFLLHKQGIRFLGLSVIAVLICLHHNNNLFRLSRWMAPKDKKDAYWILNVSRDASFEDIKASYKRLRRRFHPDRRLECDTTDFFIAVEDAYANLRNSNKRLIYDLFNPEAGKWKTEYGWDVEYCNKLSFIIPDKYIFPAWDCLPRLYSRVTGVLQQYGWFIVLGCLILLYIRSKLKPAYNQMKRKAEESRDKKIDPEVAQSRLEAMERARQRLQEQHDAKASQYMEKQLQKEEEKRQTKIEEWENLQQGKAYRSKIKPREENAETPKGLKPKPKLRDSDYNPLMGGGGGGASYRPSRRTGGGGGG